jgi:glycosyltransferase involved in cell wall biosynthesis
MIHIFINALAASAGGGLTYIRNVIPEIAGRHDVQATILIETGLRREFVECANIHFLTGETFPNAGNRLWFEQHAVRKLIKKCGADILLSAGNFAIWHAPVPQILLSRNALYTSADFVRDLRNRGEHRLWLDTNLRGAAARWSITAADCTVAPSEAFAEDLRRWTGRPIVAIHHGFEREFFARDRSPLPASVQSKLDAAGSALRLLFVSHYNYYRNFETLIRAVPLIKQRMRPRQVCLFLTCKLSRGANPGPYKPDSAAALVRDLKLSEDVITLDSIPYCLLHQLYRAANIYVTAAYAESFAHPLVEAMSSGLPIVASDLPVHKEICGNAAVYFPRFSAEGLAEQVCELANSSQDTAKICRAGIARSADFSWKLHVDRILDLSRILVRKDSGNQGRHFL